MTTYNLISTDDHVLEPADTWQKRVPAALKERAPKVVSQNGQETWVIDGERHRHVGLSAMAGRKFEEYTVAPVSFAEMRPGCHDPHHRLKDMDQDGVDAQVLFSSLPGFAGQTFLNLNDKKLALACVRAYNDFLVGEFCAVNPQRLIAQCIVPLWDAEAAAQELDRAVQLGHKGLAFSGNPESLGLKPVPDPYWNPLLARVEDLGVPMSIHIASGMAGMGPLSPGAGAPAEVFVTVAPSTNMAIVANIIFSGVPARFPKLNLVSVESGIGWIPYFLERADHVYQRHRFWTKSILTQPPSFYFRRQVYATFLQDKAGIFSRSLIGVDNAMWESDYPHSDTTWPNSQKVVKEMFAGVPKQDQRKITVDNAVKLFHLN